MKKEGRWGKIGFVYGGKDEGVMNGNKKMYEIGSGKDE